MADNSKIEWTDATWNPITGCSVVSAGCKHCYAMKLAGTRLRNHPSRHGLTVDTKAGPVWNGKVRFNSHWLDQPLRWRRPRMIFVCAHGDLFHESVPMDWISRVFGIMSLAPQHTFQVLTKRPERALGIIPELAAKHAARDGSRWPLSNVWLGVSVEDQVAADERIPLLLQCHAAVRFLSCEPLLGRINIEHATELSPAATTIDWVICGGESGKGARPMDPDWARSLRDECEAFSVPFFFKQWGEYGPAVIQRVEGGLNRTNGHYHFEADPTGRAGIKRLGKSRAGRRLDGIEHNAMVRA